MTFEEIQTAAACSPRVVIVGGPDSGKSYLAHLADPDRRRTRCTDELVGVLDWSEASAEVALWFDEPGPWLIEGVATARALRKWLRAHPSAPFDGVIVLLSTAYGERTKHQVSMAKGVATVWNEIAPELLRRGARVLKHDGTPPANASPAKATAASQQGPAPSAHAAAPTGS